MNDPLELTHPDVNHAIQSNLPTTRITAITAPTGATFRGFMLSRVLRGENVHL